MISYYKRTLRDTKLKQLKKFKPGCWINAIEPTPAEIETLHKTFNLDKQNLICGLDKNEIPRVEFVDNDTYIFLKIIILQDDKQKLHTLLITITNNFILTLSKYKIDFVDKILRGEVKFITTQKLEFLLDLFSMINKDFEKSTLSVVRSVNLMRESFTELVEQDIDLLLEQESVLNNFVSSYYYTNLMYGRIIKHMKFPERDKMFIEDLIIETQQGFDLCRSSLKTISNIRNHFVILLSNKLNKVITLLTLFTVLMSIPAAVGGLYGMNVLLPAQTDPHVFFYILLFIICVWVGVFLYLKERKII